MKDVLKYEGFVTSVHFSTEDDVFHGKLEGVDDLVTFEGRTGDELKSAMEAAVEDYQDICEEIGKV